MIGKDFGRSVVDSATGSFGRGSLMLHLVKS